MKILIIRPWPSLLDVTKNTYNIQEVGLAKALVKRGHPTDILFWTDGDEMTVEVEAEGGKPIRVFYRHGKVCSRTSGSAGRMHFSPSTMFCRPPSTIRCSHGIWPGSTPKRRSSTTAPTIRPLTRTTTGCAGCSTPFSWGATAAGAPGS